MSLKSSLQPQKSIEFVRVRKAESHRFCIEEFTVTESDVFYFNERCKLQKLPEMSIAPGTYVHLYDKRQEEVVISNTPAEIHDYAEICRKCDGRMLMCGLGLGMALHQLCMEDRISEIIVIEREPEIIDMIAPAFPEKKVTFIHGDAFNPAEIDLTGEFDTMFFDIWSDITSQTYSEMQKLSSLWKPWQQARTRLFFQGEILAYQAQMKRAIG